MLDGQFLFGATYALYGLAVASGIGGVLVCRERSDVALHQLIQRLKRRLDSLLGSRGGEQSGRVAGGQTPQAESVQVRFHCYAVQHDRAFDGPRTDRYGTELPCVSQ